MNKIKRRINYFINYFLNSLSQQENTVLCDGEVFPGMAELIRETAAEGAVLLKNAGALPINKEECVAVFGRVQLDYFSVGYGSGGDVKAPYRKNLLEGMTECGITYETALAEVYRQWCEKNPVDHGFWGHWPRFYPEMPLSIELVQNAAQKAGKAIVIIGRAAGEDRENHLEDGSYYLTKDERKMLDIVTGAFSEVIILLNLGNIIDLSWIEEYGDKINAVLLPWQGGMESGRAVAELLCGERTPCGKLPDSIARAYADYPSADCFGNRAYNEYKEDIYVGYRYFETFAPERVLYPFGYGLSYTEFSLTCLCAEHADEQIRISVQVKNIGRHSGKEVVQLYCEAPQGSLGKPARVLCGFQKTVLLAPSETAVLSFELPTTALASYDDSGVSGYPHAYVLEGGEYAIFVGNSVKATDCVLRFTKDNTECVHRCAQRGAPKESFSRIRPVRKTDGSIHKEEEKVPVSQINLKEVILSKLPKKVLQSEDMGIQLSDVKECRANMEQFVAQLSLIELEAISRGDYRMNSPLGVKGNAGVLGGVLPSLREKGVPPVTTTDGPSGIRLARCCSLLPIGTTLASAWNPSLIEKLYEKQAEEMQAAGTNVLLAPGMNIHRNPLCGRNFEYFSEDPYLTGKTAAAVVRGLQAGGVSACPKHFACNNQETNRLKNDSRLSERALREIYLKGFEICVKEASPHTIMSSYNKINGVWGHYQYELCSLILKGEWGYEGLVMTDWWMQYTNSLEFPKLRDNAYRVRAGVDVLMPGGKKIGRRKSDGTLLETLGEENGITLGELQSVAARVLTLCMRYIKS